MSHKLNSQGFTIIDLNFKRETFMKPIDSACIFNLNGFQVSISTGNSAENKGCIQEILITNLESGKEHFLRGTVEQAINDLMAGEFA